MQTHVLLSIKPQFANLILDGDKKFEFRRAIFKSKSVKKVIIYASSPVQKVIGEFELDGIISEEKEKLWKTTSKYSGIKKEYYDEYFSGKDIAHALKIKNVLRYEEPRTLQSFSIAHAPQSFQYLNVVLNAILGCRANTSTCDKTDSSNPLVPQNSAQPDIISVH